MPFHEPAIKGEMFWSRRRRRRGGCLAETRSGRVLDVSHILDLSSVRTFFCVLFWLLRPHPVFQVLWQLQVLCCLLV